MSNIFVDRCSNFRLVEEQFYNTMDLGTEPCPETRHF